MTLNTVIIQLTETLNIIKDQAPLAAILVGAIWVVYFVNALLSKKLFILGIYPRHLLGLIGIPCSPLLHGDINHLFFNSIPLFALTCFMLTAGIHLFITATFLIVIISGIGIWLLGRPAIHIGASSLIMGYWGYLLAQAYRAPSISSIIIAFICIYYFGSLIFSLFPTEAKVSWESHILGLLAGIAVNLILAAN